MSALTADRRTSSLQERSPLDRSRRFCSVAYAARGANTPPSTGRIRTSTRPLLRSIVAYTAWSYRLFHGIPTASATSRCASQRGSQSIAAKRPAGRSSGTADATKEARVEKWYAQSRQRTASKLEGAEVSAVEDSLQASACTTEAAG
eukprot:scaffold9331_cov116-Isochrysis_galbana.AAC.3